MSGPVKTSHNHHFAYIDALRGYAILAVMAVHASQLSPMWNEGIGRSLINQGARGVQLFFVASALTLMMSWHSRNDGVLNFYIRRLFRIAPMFWLAIVLFLGLNGFQPRFFAPNGIDELTVLSTALFIHGWHPEHINSLVDGGWSIAAEMTFYAVFPLMALLIRGLIASLLALFLSGIASYYLFKLLWQMRIFIWPEISNALVDNYLNLWFPNQLPVFLVGFVLFFANIRFKEKFSLLTLRVILVISILLMILMGLLKNPYGILNGKLSLYLAYGICFSLFGFALANGASSRLINRPIVALGKISFSAYIWHLVLIGCIWRFGHSFTEFTQAIFGKDFLYFTFFFPCLVISTAILSTITYRLIEQPGIWLGNRLIKRIGS